MADLAVHRREMLGATEDDVEQRMRDQHPEAVVVLVRQRESEQTKEEKR